MRYNVDDIIFGLESEESIAKLRKTAIKNDEEIKEIINLTKKNKDKCNSKISESSVAKKENNIKENTSNKEKKVKIIDVSYYKDYLLYSDTIEDLKVFMPDINNNNYKDIISSLMMSLQYDIVLKNKILRNENDVNKINKLKEELDNLYFMQSLVMEYNEEQTTLDYDFIDSKIDNKEPILLYSKTKAGNIAFIRDLKRISEEQYEYFLKLFESIRTGNLKKPRIIETYDSFAEVRMASSRITFELLTKNFYVITGAFVKKTNGRASITNSKLTQIKKIYENNKEYLLENIDNPKFIDDQNEITKEILKLLKGE